jgi:hypothetical protein
MASKRRVGSRKRPADTTWVGTRVQVKHGFLWLRRGVGTVRSTYQKEGRHFARVELDGTGKVLLRLVSTLHAAGPG